MEQKIDRHSLCLASCLFKEIGMRQIVYVKPTRIPELTYIRNYCPEITNEEIFRLLTTSGISACFMSTYYEDEKDNHDAWKFYLDGEFTGNNSL